MHKRFFPPSNRDKLGRRPYISINLLRLIAILWEQLDGIILIVALRLHILHISVICTGIFCLHTLWYEMINLHYTISLICYLAL